MGQEQLLGMVVPDVTVVNTKLIYTSRLSHTPPAMVHSYDLFPEKKHKMEYSSDFCLKKLT